MASHKSALNPTKLMMGSQSKPMGLTFLTGQRWKEHGKYGTS